MTRHLRFAVIGAGMAGILAAIRLREAGFDDIVVYEKGDGFGGTWRENSYPGLSCDVPSHLYSYSFALTTEWSRRFAPGPEIRDYFERVAAEHGVTEVTRFGTEVTDCEFANGRWRLTTAAGEHDEADVVIAATGVLHRPRYPAIEGLDRFAGASFHSARWDHSVMLDGRRVGIIGTGSTAVQLVGALVDRVERLVLFQRTAQWVMPQANPAYTAEELRSFREDPTQVRELHDGLKESFGLFAGAFIDASSPGVKMIEDACLANLETVGDPVLRERLRPTYRAACKRLVISDGFYDAMQRPTAALVTEPIAAVEPGGVRTSDGALHELDVLVLATGFDATAFFRPMRVTGRDGRTIAQEWEARPNAYLSISVPDFPNFFMLNGPNGPVGNFSLIEVAELQFGYIMQLVDRIVGGECGEISARREAMDAHEAERVAAADGTIWVTGCASWYLDDRGIPAVWPWTFERFRAEMAAPRLEAYDLR